jgi:ribosomal protein S18 acetylase RimI-like enzyme
VAVDSNYRYKGIGKALVEMGLEGLKKSGISKCHLFVFKTNTTAQAFWTNIGWFERTDLVILSKNL